ncbi:MAG: malate dehydrogenase [Gammaproteobacteria bacterium]|nr:malate dehydrogenase [Gammaproteobacteria bacterium]
MPRNKIVLVGGGQIGGILALLTTQQELGDVTIIDVPQAAEMVKGKALDIMELRPLGGHDVDLNGSGDLADVANADVVVITAGVPRRPGMNREDLLHINLRIIKDVAEHVEQYAPNAFVILTTNPLDAMVYAFYKFSGLPQNQVVGMAGALDTSRFKAFIAMEAGVSVEDVSCLVMGGHGPSMIPLIRTATVSGVPITALLSPEQIDAITERTRNAGTEIVKLLGNGSAFFNPAAAVIDMMEAHLKDKKRVIPSATLCTGEFGVNGYFVGVPAVIGAGGVEKVIEFDLTPEEQIMMDNTVGTVKQHILDTGL